MNVLVKTIGGGVFSKFMVAIQSILASVPDPNIIKNIYIDIDWDRVDPVRQKSMDSNPFDYVLNQNNELVFDKIILAKPHPCYTDINNHPHLVKLRIICGKIKIKKNVKDKAISVGGDTLGVHIRLTDMNTHHPNYGVANTEGYINKIENVLTSEYSKEIFVASDNVESLDKINDKFKTISNTTSNRSNEENKGHNYINYLRNVSANESLWVDSFVEMFSLSQCSEIIYRVSNLNNASVIFSNTIKKTHKL